MTLNLYLISQGSNNVLDIYDSAVICAESSEEARLWHPYTASKEWPQSGIFSSWCESPNQVTVKLLGTADPSIPEGIVLGSFNAG